MFVLPVVTLTSNLVPTSNVVPSNVKLASSSSSPPVPAITILLLVKSSTLALAKSAWVPISILDTERVSVVGLYVKSASSCTSPLVPTVTILPAVRSVTFTVPNVAESAARLSAFTVPSKYPCLHSFVEEPRSYVLSVLGIIDELTSALNTTLSPSPSPRLILLFAPALNVTSPSTVRVPPIVVLPPTAKLPVT